MAKADSPSGDYDNALNTFHRNEKAGGPDGPHMEIIRASTYAQLGNAIDAQMPIDRVQHKHPELPIYGWMQSWLEPGKALAPRMKALDEAGLATAF